MSCCLRNANFRLIFICCVNIAQLCNLFRDLRIDDEWLDKHCYSVFVYWIDAHKILLILACVRQNGCNPVKLIWISNFVYEAFFHRFFSTFHQIFNQLENKTKIKQQCYSIKILCWMPISDFNAFKNRKNVSICWIGTLIHWNVI